MKIYSHLSDRMMMGYRLTPFHLMLFGTVLASPSLARAQPPAPAESYQRYVQGKYMEQKIALFEGIPVNPECASKPEACQALQAHKRIAKTKPARKGSPQKDLAPHPANDFCIAVGGTPLLFLDTEKSQRNFCEFNDRSLIDSWRLYERSGRSR